jgi:hypothetical protein
MAFREATRLAPDEYEYWLWVALICERLEAWEEGVAALKQMMRLRPEGEEWQGLRQRFLETIRQQEADKNEEPPVKAPSTSSPANTINSAAEGETSPATTQESPGTPGRKAAPIVQPDDQSR